MKRAKGTKRGRGSKKPSERAFKKEWALLAAPDRPSAHPGVLIDTTPQVVKQLQALVATGYFGRTVEQCAEQLLCERLRQLLEQIAAAGRAKR